MKKIEPVLIILVIFWAVFAVNFILPIDLNRFGIYPRNIRGLWGIVFSPFLHANIFHIISNSVPFLVLGSMLFLFYTKNALRVFVYSIIISGVLVWIFARPAIHIGMSGVIYAMATFLIFAGFYKRKIASILISILVIVLYGGLIWGLFPNNFYVSWEGHLGGAIAGFILAQSFYKKD
jgi:membrane associated rhomboid family serine protease